MKLSERQKKIVEIVKEHQPLSGEKISELLDFSDLGWDFEGYA